MNRRSFLTKLGIGTVAAAVVPEVLVAREKKVQSPMNAVRDLVRTRLEANRDAALVVGPLDMGNGWAAAAWADDESVWVYGACDSDAGPRQCGPIVGRRDKVEERFGSFHDFLVYAIDMAEKTQRGQGITTLA